MNQERSFARVALTNSLEGLRVSIADVSADRERRQLEMWMRLVVAAYDCVFSEPAPAPALPPPPPSPHSNGVLAEPLKPLGLAPRRPKQQQPAQKVSKLKQRQQAVTADGLVHEPGCALSAPVTGDTCTCRHAVADNNIIACPCGQEFRGVSRVNEAAKHAETCPTAKGLEGAKAGAKKKSASAPGYLSDFSIDDLDLSVRAHSCLARLNIASIQDLVTKTEADLLKGRNFGRVSLNEVKAKLKARGLYLKDAAQ